MGPYMDQAVHRVAVSGPILAHILQDFGASHGDCDGVLFGHLDKTISPKLEDDDEQSGLQEELTAIITGFHCSGSLFSFYDASGRIDPAKLLRLVGDRESRGGDPVIGWFSGRRNTPMRPSLRETAVTRYFRLSHSTFSSNHEGFGNPSGLRGSKTEAPYPADGSLVVGKTPVLKSGASSPVHVVGSPVHSVKIPSHMPGSPSQVVSPSGGMASPIDIDTLTSDVGIKLKPRFHTDGSHGGPFSMSGDSSLVDVKNSPNSNIKSKNNQAVALQGSSLLGTWSVGVPPSSPCVFMLLTDSGAGQAVHTHDYRAYQYHFGSQMFEPRTVKIVNIGPAFRMQYDSFSPVVAFPLLLSTTEGEGELNSSSTGLRTKRRESHEGSRRTRAALPKEQALLDVFSEGYKVERLASLVEPDGMRQVPELEDLYSKMLLKLEILAKQVCDSSSALIQQEKVNTQMRLNSTSL